MKQSKTLLTVLAAGTLISFLLLLLYAQVLVAVSATPDLDTLAITFVNLLEEGKFEDAAELFNEQMAEALPPQELEAAWNDLTGRIGEFKEITEVKVTEEKGYRVVYATCDFAKTALDVKIVFDDDGKIAGLWFVPATEGLHPIYIAALIATATSALLWGGLAYWFSKRKWMYLALMLITLPFSAIVNLWIKKPVYEFLLSSLDISELSMTSPVWFLVFVLFLSPVTEEAVKLSPLLAKQVRRMIDRSSALWTGMGLGMGFGIGEIWYLAWGFSMVPGLAGYPFYYFGGFIWERVTVVFIHGVMTAVAVTAFTKRGKGLLTGYIGAVFLHAFTNIGAMLYQTRLWDETLASLYLLLPAVVAILIFEHLRKKGLTYRKHAETVLFSRSD